MIDSNYTIVFVVGLILYLGVMMYIGVRAAKKSDNKGEGFILGNKNFGLMTMIATSAASAIGVGTSVGSTAHGFRSGWLGAVFPIANGLGLLTIALAFAFVRKYNFRTLPEETQFYYKGNPAIRKLMGFVLVIICTVWVGSAINGGANYLAYLMGMNLTMAKFIILLAFGVYIIVGGFTAVVWSDVVQAWLLFIGFIAMVLLSIPKAGGFEAIQATYANAGNTGALSFLGIDSKGIAAFVSLFVASYFGSMSGISAHQRIYSAKNEKLAKKAIMTAGIIVTAFCFLPALVGMSAFSIATQSGSESVLANPDFAFAFIATEVFPPFLGLIFLIAGLSAIMSSADSDALAGVSVFVTDVRATLTGKPTTDDQITKTSRIALFVMLGVAFLMSLGATDVMSYISKVTGSFTPGVSIALILGRFWKRATWQGGVSILVTGLLLGVCYLLIAPFSALVDGTFGGPAPFVAIVTLVIGVVVSLVTPQVNLSEEEIVAKVMETREGKAKTA